MSFKSGGEHSALVEANLGLELEWKSKLKKEHTIETGLDVMGREWAVSPPPQILFPAKDDLFIGFEVVRGKNSEGQAGFATYGDEDDLQRTG